MSEDQVMISVPQWVSIRTAFVLEQSIEDSQELLGILEKLIITSGTRTKKDIHTARFHEDHIKDCKELLQHYEK